MNTGNYNNSINNSESNCNNDSISITPITTASKHIIIDDFTIRNDAKKQRRQ
jgi:hypothetical protein